MAVLDDHNFIELSKSTIKKGREYLKKELEILDCRVFPSQANFLMFKPPIDAETVFEKLLRRGIIIRPLNSYGLNDYLRVSIGREDENRRFIEALKEILKEER
jgi:histidinol-phosphate aminotransferase